MPLLHRASEWKVPTTFIYGVEDWMSYKGAKDAREKMPEDIECDVVRVPEAGHFVFIDNPSAFHSAVYHACRKFFSRENGSDTQPQGLEFV